MLDVSLTRTSFTVDKRKNAVAYCPDVTAAAILGGQVAPPEEMAPLWSALRHAGAGAMAAAFESSAHEESSRWVKTA